MKLLLVWIALAFSATLNGSQLTVQIEHRWDGKPLPLSQMTLRNAAGNTLSVTRLAYLLSHAQLCTEDGRWIGANDWIAFLDVEKKRTSFTLGKVPAARYTALRFDLGLDEATDKSDPAKHPAGHPLNPELNDLHWSWRGGYVFLALEGHHAQSDGGRGGYSYHLAGQPCRGTIEVPVEMDLRGDLVLTLAFDAERIFGAQHKVDIGEVTSTHSHNDGGLAERLADNAVQAFALLRVEPDMMARNFGDAMQGDGGKMPPLLVRPLIPSHFPQTQWPADNPLTKEGVALGRRLFHETRLSINGTQSCASCHLVSSAFADPRRVSLGAEAQQGARNAMPLFNLAWRPSFFWDGRAPTLRDQVLRPIQDVTEMHETLPGVTAKLAKDESYVKDFERAFGSRDITADKLSRALEQFLLTLISGQSKVDLARQGKATLTNEEKLGFTLFFTESDPGRGVRGADCFHCHGGAHFTNSQFLNSGLDADDVRKDEGRFRVTQNAADKGRFAVPSLRNVALTAPYMHDGRFATLEEVIEHYDHGVKRSATLDPNLAKHLTWGGLGLSKEEQAALAAFLRALTDEAFVRQP